MEKHRLHQAKNTQRNLARSEEEVRPTMALRPVREVALQSWAELRPSASAGAGGEQNNLRVRAFVRDCFRRRMSSLQTPLQAFD